MNKHTLNYHTRLHDWYRQHSILQEKHQQQTIQQEAGTRQVAPEAGVGGTLTQDKLHFISDWCSDVNKALFRIKKKEPPPLFRRCKLSANSSCREMTKSADPRRIRSAEVFTLSGHWAKQPKAIVNGGELLPQNKAKSGKDAQVGEQKETKPQVKQAPALKADPDHLDLCVRNSKEGDSENKVLPRVNHDSLNLRANAFILKQNGGRPTERSINSPRCSVSTTSSHHVRKSSAFRRVKSAAPATANRRQDVIQESYRLINTKGGHGRSQKETDLLKNAKNEEYSRRAQMRPPSHKSHVTSKTDDTYPETDDEGRLARPIINVVVSDEQHIVPTFCSKCSGIYASDTRPPSTSTACGNCIHGITIGTDDNCGAKRHEKELAAKRLAELERKVDEEISRTEVEVKKVENRLTEDSIHYTAERDTLRQGEKKPGFTLPNTFDDLEDERNISFDDVDDDDDDNHDGENDTDQQSSTRGSDHSTHSHVNEILIGGDADRQSKKRVARVTIKTEDIAKHDNSDDDGPPDPKLLNAYKERRGERRMSINFTVKPTIGNISTSNSLLHVLSIDDCKVNMRYSPHKVLEEHEITDNIATPPSLINASNFSLDKEGEATSKVAMRISKDSSSITSLQSSTVNDATRVNKKKYKILYDPEDLDFYKNKRPSSAALAKAFHTLIHDRTIMQRLDQVSSTTNTKSGRAVSSAHEGPTYRRINAALKKHMGDVLQDHCVQLRNRYERLQSGSMRRKPKKDTSLTSHSPTISLSLESLPVVKKGILKNTTTENRHHKSLESLSKSPEN